MAAYLAACLPLLALRHFDASVFVVAGAHYVDAARTHPPLRVKAGSDGYDGQFYYRLAVHPFSLAAQADGITFDHPAKRMQRILYPLLGWAVSLGQAAAASWALLAVNIAGIGVIAWCACYLTMQLGLAPIVPAAIMLWPGFIVTLLHDTTEIVSAAFMLGALCAYLDRRALVYAGLAACAALTRETNLAVFAGMLGYTAFASRGQPAWRGDAWRVLVCALPLLPCIAWHAYLASAWPDAGHFDNFTHDLGWPLLGAARMLWACLLGTRSWGGSGMKSALVRGYVLISAVPLLAFCAFTATRVPAALRQAGAAPVACGWLVIAGLMSLLSAQGPWIGPVAYFRAFTECYVLGCLVIGGRSCRLRAGWVWAVGLAEMALAWSFCMMQLR